MAAFTYEYRVKGLVKAPIEEVGKLFTELQDSPDGLSPETILEASREEGTLLHDEFEWNNDTAAEKYRIEQAKMILRNVEIRIERPDGDDVKVTHVRAFVNLPGGTSNYAHIGSVLNDQKWRDHLFEEAKREMRSFIAKYRNLGILEPVIVAMEGLIDKDPVA